MQEGLERTARRAYAVLTSLRSYRKH